MKKKFYGIYIKLFPKYFKNMKKSINCIGKHVKYQKIK